MKIIETKIENDVVNNSPTIVFVDETGMEWVYEEQSSNHGGFITKLVEKKNSWYFNPSNKQQ